MIDPGSSNPGRLATALVISRIRWTFLPLAAVGVLTNVPPPVNVSLFVATLLFVTAFNTALTLHGRLPHRLVQPLIALAMAGDVFMVGVTMYEFAADPADLGWGFLMLVGPAAAVLYGWRGLFWFGPPMLLALAGASLAGEQFATPNGVVGFLHKGIEIVGVTVIVAFLAERNERQTVSLERANSNLERLTLTDPLTGIANRRCFESRWEYEREGSVRTHRPLAMAIADIDHFKLINDMHGHAAGDQVLKLIAAALRSATRTTDLVARIGGEEFAFVLPGTNERDALAYGERIRKAVSDIRFKGLDLECAISVGVASSESAPMDDLQVSADTALYRAKAAGRNRVESWRGDLQSAA